jgi:Mor family transcriptional regulator
MELIATHPMMMNAAAADDDTATARPPRVRKPTIVRLDMIEQLRVSLRENIAVLRQSLREHPDIAREAGTTPDLVDRLLQYVQVEFEAQIETAIRRARSDFAGSEGYVKKRDNVERERIAREVLALFNGRNGSEVARRLGIGRATVYRIVRQSRAVKP